MYNEKFVATIKVNGKILRENKSDVFLPFGSHYSILLKNLNTIACKVNIFIDGSQVAENYELLIEAGQSVEIERFIKNGNLKAGNKFKFIEKTDNIEKFRGNKVEDGLIRVEYQFEKFYPPLTLQPYIHHQPHYSPYWNNPLWRNPNEIYCATSFHSGNSISPNSMGVNAVSGITVPGEISNQRFNINHSNKTYESVIHSMIFNLIGKVELLPEHITLIQKPLTVKDSLICPTCGKKNKASSNFCSECGTSLIIR